jgi:ribosomal protein S18 acetylase RimI-like enzyme
VQPPFRPAGASDHATLLELMREFYAHEQIAFDAAAAGAALRMLLEDERHGRAVLIEPEGRLAGYLIVAFGFSLEFQGRDAFVDELWVREPFRGRGLGTQALELAAELCRAAGVRALHLEVEHANRRAQAVYRRAGFSDRPHYLMTRRL